MEAQEACCSMFSYLNIFYFAQTRIRNKHNHRFFAFLCQHDDYSWLFNIFCFFSSPRNLKVCAEILHKFMLFIEFVFISFLSFFFRYRIFPPTSTSRILWTIQFHKKFLQVFYVFVVVLLKPLFHNQIIVLCFSRKAKISINKYVFINKNVYMPKRFIYKFY